MAKVGIKKNDCKEGDIIALFGQRHNRKRVVFCERLRRLALQNKQHDGGIRFKDEFDQNVRGNKDLSTFDFLPNFDGNMEKVGFSKIKRDKYMKSKKTHNLIHPCEICGKKEGVWRIGTHGEGSNQEEAERDIDSRTGYFCDDCEDERIYG
ncbi:MAG: hypothetical protein PHY02_06405 [Phycisphaerae bacterium]|nr:hypothetical protein [Phycisphaerae bacterium]